MRTLKVQAVSMPGIEAHGVYRGLNDTELSLAVERGPATDTPDGIARHMHTQLRDVLPGHRLHRIAANIRRTGEDEFVRIVADALSQNWTRVRQGLGSVFVRVRLD